MGITNSASGILNSSPSGCLPYFVEGEITIGSSPKKLCPQIKSNISRVIQIKNTGDYPANILWSEKATIRRGVEPGEIYADTSCGHELWGVSELGTKLEISIRQSKSITYSIGEELMIPVKVRLCIGTGTNFIARSESDFDSDSTQYLINLYKIKNSDSGVTGFKLFDIFCFHPGMSIDFNVTVENPTKYGNIALQLFDPISVGEALFDVANDVVNLELNNLSDSFVGNITRNALYKDVFTDKVTIYPDLSRHVGRFVAVNQTSGKYDTAIIKYYTANSDIYKGGTFTLTGDF